MQKKQFDASTKKLATVEDVPTDAAFFKSSPTNPIEALVANVKEFWTNGGIARNAVIAVLLCLFVGVVSLSTQYVYNIYAVGHNMFVSIKA
jgi:hypothetical protein